MMKKLFYIVLGIIILTSIFVFTKRASDRKVDLSMNASFPNSAIHYDGPAKFASFHKLIRTRENSTVPNYKMGYQKTEFDKAKSNIQSRGANIDWIERGPGNVGGRTRGLIVDPADMTHKTWFTGTAGGGIWKTEDAGHTWRNLTSNLPNLATSALAMSAHNPDVIYAGTGEGFDGAMVNGSGIWKSTDHGETWTALSSTTANIKFQNIMRMIVNPNDEDELVIATVSSPRDDRELSFIMKSTDGGITWHQKYQTVHHPIQQIVMNPSDFNIQYASINGKGVYQSKDAGETWKRVFDGENHGLERMELAVSPVDNGYIYIACESGFESTLYFTSDSCKSFNGVFYLGEFPNWMGEQGWYDNTIAAHPFDKNKVWVGGSGSIIEFGLGDGTKDVSILKTFENNTSFLVDVTKSQIPVPSHGLARKLTNQLQQDSETDASDLIDMEVRFGPGIQQKAHLININLVNFAISYGGFVDVPFQAWDTKNNRQLILSFIDVNGNGKWDFDTYNGGGVEPDIVLLHNLDYADTADVVISTQNQVYKAEYEFYKQKSPNYDGDDTNFPEGNFKFIVGKLTGLSTTFASVTDGYSQFGGDSKGVHVDHHNLILIPVDEATQKFYVLNANDGGVAFSDDNGATFFQTGDTFNEDGDFETLKGYNVAQFYGVDKMNGADRYVGGTQDNGSWVSPKDADSQSEWVSAPSGDGFGAAWNYGNTNLVLESSQYNFIAKSKDGGATWNPVDLPSSEGPFITTIASSQIEPDLVFLVSNRGVIKSTDFGDHWQIKDMPDSWNFSEFYTAVEISLADPNVVWSGSDMTNSSGLAVSTDQGETWSETNNYSLAELGRVSGLATHPTDPNTAYALFALANGPKILKTKDLGQTWTDISGFRYNKNNSKNGFPDVATYSLLVMPFDTSRIWVGTEIGLFESTDAGDSWHYANNGLPAVGIWQMRIVNDEIVLATHGRGIWTVNTSELGAPVSNNDIHVAIDFEINLAPNPMTDVMKIELKTSTNSLVDIQLVDMNGRILKSIYTGNVGDNITPFTLNRDGLNAGVYLIRVNMDGKSVSKRFVIL